MVALVDVLVVPHPGGLEAVLLELVPKLCQAAYVLVEEGPERALGRFEGRWAKYVARLPGMPMDTLVAVQKALDVSCTGTLR